jgi:Cu-Zn family superoxide dismutase
MQRTILVLAVALCAAACSKGSGKAVANLEPRSGSQTTGTVTFTDKDGKVEVVVAAKALAPGKHGVYLHEKGDCTGSNASAVGHRFATAEDPHAGDLGDLNVGADGLGNATFTYAKGTVAPGARSLVSRAIVISTDPDNPALKETFGIVACGVISPES